MLPRSVMTLCILAQLNHGCVFRSADLNDGTWKQEQTAALALRQTVEVRARFDQRRPKSGSGLVISVVGPDRRLALIVTCAHVIVADDSVIGTFVRSERNAPSDLLPATVEVADLNGTAQRARVVAYARIADLALLEVPECMLDVEPVTFSRAACIAPGSPCIVAGNMLSLSILISAGTVSDSTGLAIRRLAEREGQATSPSVRLAIDARVAHGSSGGGVWDVRSGECLGMVTVMDQTSSLAFATPADLLRLWIDDLKSEKDIQGASIGASLRTKTSDASGQPEFEIVAVDPGSPAEAAGLDPGDEILAVNGTVLRGEMPIALGCFRTAPVDWPMRLLVRRGRSMEEATVWLRPNAKEILEPIVRPCSVEESGIAKTWQVADS